MAENTRLPRLRPDHAPAGRPGWAAITDRFYADSFDASTEASLVESMEAFADLTPEEAAFHQAHLTFLQIGALADILATLKGIERGVEGLDPQALAALKHLPGVRKALVVIARGQQEMMEMMEAGGPGVGDGGEEEEEEELRDDRGGDDVEDEDHGHGDAVEPDEILPRGAA